MTGHDTFHDRTRELASIASLVDSRKFELVIVYGRRRVGKTALVLQSLKARKHVYFLAETIDNLPRFFNACLSVEPGIANIKEEFHAIIDFMKDKVDAVVIDEFQNLVAEHPNVPFMLQAMIDGPLRSTRLKLFLVGSSISMMTSLVLSSPSPLYGRKTASLKLGPVSFVDMHEFFPDSTLEEHVDMFAFSGGIPYYMNMIDKNVRFWSWLNDELHQPTCFIDHELEFLMRYEFTRPEMYMRIMDAIATGCTKFNDIATRLHVKTSDITPYMNVLLTVDFIGKEIPFTEGPRSRNGRYFVRDHFMAFWYRCILPYKSTLEQRILSVDMFKPRFQTFLGVVFEDVVRQFMIACTPVPFTRIGRWWRKDVEIDLVLHDEPTSTVTFIECEWSDKVHPKDLLAPLETKMTLFPMSRARERVMLFARTFSERVTSWDGRDVLCLDAKDIEARLRLVRRG